MFKRVLLLLLLVTVLVVPGAAVTVSVPTGSLDEWNVVRGSWSTAGGLHATGTSLCEIRYDFPAGLSASDDYDLVVSVTADNSPASALGECYFGLYTTDGLSHRFYISDGYNTNTFTKLQAWVGEERYARPYDTAYTDFSGDVVFSRRGDQGSVSVGGVTVLTASLSAIGGDIDYFRFISDRSYSAVSMDMYIHSLTFTGTAYADLGEPCTINIYDADTRLPLSGAWNYYVVIEGADAVSGSASGASTVVNLPETSILQPHLLRVTKEGYVQVPEILAINVPAGGREIHVYLRSTTAPPEEGNVWLGFTCTDADTGSPVSSALVNLDGSAQYTGASGYVRFQVPMNSTHEWVASSSSHWPMGGTVTVETADLNVPVELVRKTSDLPRPPLPDLPNFPVIHPSLDPTGFRMQILSVPILGGLASPILDTMDAIAVGLDDIVHPILDFVTAPADSMLQALEGVGDQLTVSVTTYTNIAGVVLGSVGKLLAVFPDLVIGLVTYNLVLDLVYLLLRGGL